MPRGRPKRHRADTSANSGAPPTRATTAAALATFNAEGDNGANETSGENIALTVALFAQRERYVHKVVGACFYANASAEAQLLGRTGSLDADGDLEYMIELIHSQAIGLATRKEWLPSN
jgi:hypothetical protein